jgi:hypothetical protein
MNGTFQSRTGPHAQLQKTAEFRGGETFPQSGEPFVQQVKNLLQTREMGVGRGR